MLVLSRKLGQRIVVPHSQVAITVLAVEGRRVRLGVCAPGDIAVYREEVWREIRQQFDGSSQAAPKQPRLETLAAELAEAVYTIALRAGTENSWINLELRLWKTLARTIKLWAQELPHAASQRNADPTSGADRYDHQPDESCSLAAIAGET